MKPKLYARPITLFIALILLFIPFIVFAKADSHAGFQFEEGKYQSTFHFQMAGNLIILPVSIEGKRLNLIFDTGMNSILLFSKRHIEDWSEFEKHTVKFSGLGTGKTITGKRLDGLSVKMPNINGKGLSLVVTPWSRFPKKLNGVDIDGVFGYQLLAKFIVQIDYKNQKITLIEPEYFVKPRSAAVLDLNVYNTKPYVKCPVTIDSNKHMLNLLVDTGAEARLIINAESIDFEIQNHKTESIGYGLAGALLGQKIRVNHIELGGQTSLVDFEALVPTKRSYPNENEKLVRDGTLGGETLKKFKVTFDYFNNKLYLESGWAYKSGKETNPMVKN